MSVRDDRRTVLLALRRGQGPAGGLERAAGVIVEPPAGKQRKKMGPRRHLSLDFVTMAEVAEYCCVSESFVARGVREKTWPFNFLRQVRIGKRVLFSRASFFHMGRAMRRAAEADPNHL